MTPDIERIPTWDDNMDKRMALTCGWECVLWRENCYWGIPPNSPFKSNAVPLPEYTHSMYSLFHEAVPILHASGFNEISFEHQEDGAYTAKVGDTKNCLLHRGKPQPTAELAFVDAFLSLVEEE